MFFAHTRESANPYYKLLRIVKLENIYKFRICYLISKIMNKAHSIPDIISDILPPASSIRRYKRRFAGKLNLFTVRISTSSEKSSFKFAGPMIWESVTPEIKRLSFISFKKAWKCHLLINQSRVYCWLDAE